PVIGDRELGDVRKHDPDPMAGLDAVLAQQSGDPRGGVVEVGVGQQLILAKPERRTGGVVLGGADQVVCEVLVHPTVLSRGGCAQSRAATQPRTWGRLRIWRRAGGGWDQLKRR